MDLSDEYANGAYIKNADRFPEQWAAAARDFRNEMRNSCQLDVPYGSGPRQKFDLFMPNTPAKGLFVFVHGGYWMALDKNSWSHLAAGMIAHSWAVAIPSYDLCPSVRVSDITRMIAHAVAQAAREIPGPIALAGHSAGGHLVSRMLDRNILPNDVGVRIKAVMPISPLSDLRPLLRTDLNQTLHLNTEEAESESPLLTRDRYDAKVTVWVGAQERPAFLDQAKWLSEAWQADCVVAAGKHHFDVIDPLMVSESDMVAAIFS
ncbi:MAG: alpha/beta hydrolase [Paracoccaceae bacterium]